MDDLDAYVCLFDDCDNPEELYNHSRNWLKHMSKHTLRWRCKAKSHGILSFVTGGEYVEHMKEKHPRAFSEPQLRVLAKYHGRSIKPMFGLCPICGNNEVTGNLEDHIIGHLRSLALKSLPPYDDGGSEDSSSDQGCSNTSKPMSRSTIQEDPARYAELAFEDVGDASMWGYNGDPVVTSPRLQLSTPPEIEGVDESEGSLLWHKDPSIDLIELSLFDGISTKDRRMFEWGFLTERTDRRLESAENDPTIQSILEYNISNNTKREALESQHHNSGTQDQSTSTRVTAQTIDNLRMEIVRKSSGDLELLRKNGNTNGPILLVGASVGVAPFRSFLKRRLENLTNDNTIWVLRNTDDSIINEIYSNQWGIPEDRLKNIIQDLAVSMKPIQELVRTKAHMVWYIINSVNGCIWTCSDSRRRKGSIEKALVDVAIKQGNLREEEAQTFWSLKAEIGQYIFHAPRQESILPSITMADEIETDEDKSDETETDETHSDDTEPADNDVTCRYMNVTDALYHCCRCGYESHFLYNDDKIDCPQCFHRNETGCCVEV